MWILLGDFNAVRDPTERLNTEFNPSCAGAFNSFIEDNGLNEYPMGGRKYTRVADAGNKLSKIDRILVCEAFWNKWPNVSVTALPRFASDHSPVILSAFVQNFGAAPFRFYNSYIGRCGLDEVVANAVNGHSYVGPPDVVLANKLRKVKDGIKLWLHQNRDNLQRDRIEIENKISELDKQMEGGDLSEAELLLWTENKRKWEDIKIEAAQDLRQKARVKWAVEGDENTSFFHGIINYNIASSRINGMQVNNEWVTDPIKLKHEARKFFAFKFREPTSNRPVFSCPGISRLSEADADSLIAPFTVEEVKDAVWDCGSDRAPGPDGFNFGFLKHYWDLLREDIMKLMEYFHNFGVITRGCGSSFIALIPKCLDPTDFNDFRPISLIGCISKIISKTLANRLKKVIGTVVSEFQSGFLASRNILDGPLILNEVIAWLKKSRLQAFLLKVDIEKAYDTISWDFIISVLTQMGFPERWRVWVRGILESSRASVLLNGSPTWEFQCYRGVRQGDPLSPFIFILAMEALTTFVRKADDLGLIRGIRTPNNGPILTHLMYADDVIFLGDWGDAYIRNIARLMRCFHMISGLKMNLNKTSIFGLNVSDAELEGMADSLNYKADKLPCKYLGLPIGVSMNQRRYWSSVVEAFKTRLSKWKAKHLSFGGRVVLLKAALDSLPLYFFSSYKAPKGVIDSLEALRRRFFWGGNDEKTKTSWVSWERVIGPTEKGGLGLGSLKNMNLSLLMKWWWRFKVEKGTLWVRVIEAIHSQQNSWSYLPIKSGISGAWSGIVKLEKELDELNINTRCLIKAKMGNGEATRFWIDWWAGDAPLMYSFPDLFSLEKEKNVSIANRIQRWDWRCYPSSVTELMQLQMCSDLVQGALINSSRDSWTWVDSSDGLFSVAGCRRMLTKYAVPFCHFQWIKGVPKKVCIFGWRAEQDRLPTLVGLKRRKIIHGDSTCKLCGEGDEDANHLFTSCYFASVIWQKISSWCNIPPIFAFSIRDLLNMHSNVKGNGRKKSLVRLVIVAACWIIWKARNEYIFTGRRANVNAAFGEIQTISFTWVKHRLKGCGWTWESWLRFESPIT